MSRLHAPRLLIILILGLSSTPISHQWLFVSEVNLHLEGSTGPDQFVELTCYYGCRVPSHSYKLVFVDSETVYKVIMVPGSGSPMSHDDRILVGPSTMGPDIDWGDFTIHLDSPSAVVLYNDPSNQVAPGQLAPSFGVSSVITFTMHNPINHYPSTLVAIYPRNYYTNYLVPEPDKSINYCYRNFKGVLLPPTPKAQNYCPSVVANIPQVIINELNAASPRYDMYEFVELRNISPLPVHLGEYTLVLYDGGTNLAYKVIPINNATLPAGGLYVVGSYRLTPAPDQVLQEGSLRVIQNGADAVALFRGPSSNYTVGSGVTDEGLVDAVVYDVRGRHSETLTAILTPGEETLHENWRALNSDESLSRCSGTDARNSSQFGLYRRSHGRANFCTRSRGGRRITPPATDANLSPVVINEFSLVISNCYLELYDGGIGNYSLDGLLVVIYGSRAMRAMQNPLSLNGYTTNSDGYFLIKVGDSASESEASLDELPTVDIIAITLYLEHVNNIQKHSYVTSKNLVDVVLYGTPVVTRGFDLVDALLPGATPLSLDGIQLTSNSYSRCRGWAPFQLSSFVITSQSPGGRNSCPLPTLVINEIDLAQDPRDRFIELFSEEESPLLDGIVLTIYEKGSAYPDYVFSLDGNVVNSRGFATIGHVNGTSVDIAIDALYMGWSEDIGAVALHLGSTYWVEYSESVPTDGLVDALVVSHDAGSVNLDLMNALTPHQTQLNDLSEDTSISRCFCCTRLSSSNFGAGVPTPGEVNRECTIGSEIITESLEHHQSLLRINEVSATQGGNGLFIELYDGGYGHLKMDHLTLSLYAAGHGFYSHYSLQKEGPLGKTNSGGLYNVGTPSSAAVLNVQIHENERFLRGTTNAVILWKDNSDSVSQASITEIDRNDIIDAVAFSDAAGYFDYGPMNMFRLTWSNITLNATFMEGGYSLSRCHSQRSGDQLAFAQTVSTPGSANTCPLPDIFINEFNFMVRGGDEVVRFIELADRGIGKYPLNGLVLVVYSRSGKVYRSYSINGQLTDYRGLFILGHKRARFPPLDMPIFTSNESFISTEAVALFRGQKRDFPQGRQVSNKSLIDAVIFGSRPANQTLIDVLTPGRSQAPTVTTADRSISRCVEQGPKVVRRRTHISPKHHNFCPYNSISIVINEVSLEEGNQFVEIWDLGIGLSALNNVSIVLFNNDGRPYMDISLNDHWTDSGGYFVIGTKSVIPRSPYDRDMAGGFIHTTSGAVALYRTAEGYPMDAEAVITTGLIDAVVYSDESEVLSSDLRQAFSTGAQPLQSLLLQEEGLSLSRCFSEDQLAPNSFSSGPITPLGLNDCPVFESDIIISELKINNITNPGDESDFIELYDGGRGGVSLDGLTLVLFDGQYQGRSYFGYSFDGLSTNEDGFFIISAKPLGKEAGEHAWLYPGFLHDGPVGVVIYRAPKLAFSFGTLAEPQSVVDAIVYSMNTMSAESMVTKLTPGYPIFRHTWDTVSLGISRCYSNRRRDPTAFGIAETTLGKVNNCSSARAVYPVIVINEVNIEPVSGNSQYEYIELYDLGAGDTSLDGYSLIFYDGGNDGRSYFEVDLKGQRTDSNGFFTVGTETISYSPNMAITKNNFLQNGPDAIVLYRRPASDFPRASYPVTEGAIDVVVYGTDDDEQTTTLVDKFTPGQIQINEQQLHLAGRGSLSRCLSNDTMSLMAFITSYKTPGSPNNCTPFPIYINEINLDTSEADTSDFIELYDGGRGYTPLDSVVLVLYSESAGMAFGSLPLQNNRTDRNGYFTVGGASASTDLTIDSRAFWGMLSMYPGAVAIYRGSNLLYQPGMEPTAVNLLDTVILGGAASPATNLGSVLAPNQPQILEQKFFLESDESVSRCTCCHAIRMTDFALGPATPQAANNCTTLAQMLDTGSDLTERFVVISEVSLVVDTRNGVLPMEVELYGSPSMALDNYVLVYYIAGPYATSSYLVISLSGCRIDSDGYYTLTQEAAERLETLGGDRSSKTDVRAVALYDRLQGEFSFGMKATAKGLVDALTFTDGSDRAGDLRDVLSSPLTSIITVNSDARKYLESYGPLSLSRCACCSQRNNSAFALTAWTPGQPNTCPGDRYQGTIHLRLLNADYSMWSSNRAWKFYLKEVIVKGIEDICKCGFTMAYFKDERLLEGSVVFAAELLSLDQKQAQRIFDSYKSFVRQSSTITITEQTFNVDSCTENCVYDARAKQIGGKAGGIVGALFAVIILLALIAVAVVFARKYKAEIHMMYIKNIKLRGSPDGVRFNNNAGLDDGVVNPVYEGNSQSDAGATGSQFEDPTANTTGEVPHILTC